MKQIIVSIVFLFICMSSKAQTVDSCAFYKSEYQRLRVKVQLAQQNIQWLNRFVDIVAKHPSQASFVVGWSNRVNAAKLFPADAVKVAKIKKTTSVKKKKK